MLNLLKKVLWVGVLWLCAAPISGISGGAEVYAQVDTAWVRRYNGPANDDDRATALAVDGSGNVYVTGQSVSSGIYRDYATIKYYPGGDTAWVRRYNGPGNMTDDAYAMAVDGLGNVYVTGASVGSGTSFDYATVKYKPNGDTAWVRRYNGPSNNSDGAVAIAVDGAGNVCVTGSSPGSGTSGDYATIKYYPNGDTAWVRRYNGPANGSDSPNALAVSDSGNVYVTGGSNGSGTDRDYATIKYYPNGDTAWIRRYNGPVDSLDYAMDIVTDGSGNVYVTGVSRGYETGDDYATIKYYPNGDTAWVRRYNGPANSIDRAQALAVDGSGNVYVTGWSYGSGTDYDYATIKYYPNGDTAWVRRYNGPVNYVDQASDIVVDGSRNVYVTGWSRGTDGDDYTTIKYYPNVDTAWVRRYNGSGTGNAYAADMVVDGSNNVYVTGYTGYLPDYATIKYVQYLLGDANNDGSVDVGDVVYLINYLFKNGPLPVPILKAGDASCNGTVDVGDVIYLINYLFKGGPSPSC